MQRIYNVIVQTYTNETEVEVTRGCNAFSARNIGTDICFVNGIILQPAPGVGLSGESVTIEGNEDEVYKGRIQVRFAGGALLIPNVEIVQKFFINENSY